MTAYITQSTALLVRRIADDCWRGDMTPAGRLLKAAGVVARERIVSAVLKHDDHEQGSQDR